MASSRDESPLSPPPSHSLPAASPAPPSAVEPKPRAPRAHLVHAVMCRFAEQPEYAQVITLNISQSGMLIEGPPDLPRVGSSVDFKFVLESGFEILWGSGTVARQAVRAGKKVGLGVAFGVLDPSQQRILARIVELHSEQDPS